ncbi:MAG TPA: carboxypeptidase-like regulatory domain-containing protein [Anaerolineae bacterium]|nr:carboxypeptidase-like regulatory domain-containing protein [Anaerolineae bacterium]
MPWVDAERARPDRRTATPWPPAQPEPSAWPIGPSATSPAPATTAQPTRPRLARIAGRVEDPDGQPVPMALVYLRPAQSGEGWGVVLTDTDGNGRFSLDLPPGRWELWVEAAGLPPWRYQDEPVLDLGGQAERGGILVRLPESPPPPSLPTPSPSFPPPTGTAPAAAPVRIAPILPPAVPTSPIPDPTEPQEWMP